jgi:hypothetical protein
VLTACNCSGLKVFGALMTGMRVSVVMGEGSEPTDNNKLI